MKEKLQTEFQKVKATLSAVQAQIEGLGSTLTHAEELS